MADKVRIGILGAGRIGKLHAINLQNAVTQACVVALADPYMNEEMRTWATDLGIPKITDNPQELFEDEEVDAIFICSSTDTHAEFIKKAAAAKKHVFCEKPIHTELDKIKESIQAADEAGIKLQVGFVRRFDHNHKKVRDTVASKMLGAPHIVKVSSRDPEAPPMEYVKVSGGIFMDMMIHDFDMARFLSGSEVTEVTAYGAVLVDPRFAQYHDIDTAIVMLKFENGAIGVIDNSRRAPYGYDQRSEVHCEKGCVQVGNDLCDTSMISTAEGVICAKPTWFFLERYNDAFIEEEKEFVDILLHDKDVPVGGMDGLMAVKIAMAAQMSLEEGRPVKLSEL